MTTDQIKPPKMLDITERQPVQYCIPAFLKFEQVKINVAKCKGRIEAATQLRSEPIALVSFGPSLNQTWEKIRGFKYVMSCSGSHKFLVDRGIIPTHHLDVDPREHKIKLIGTPQKTCEYLIASTCHPKLIDFIEEHGGTVKLWHIFDSEEEGYRILPPGEWMVTGGCLHAAALVHTQDGQKPIRWIVKNKYSGLVLSMDAFGKFVWRPIIGHSGPENTAKKKWVSLRGANRYGLILTEDHRCAVLDDPLNPKIYYRPAGKTAGTYSVRLPTDDRPPTGNDYALYNDEQLAVLYGTLLGDSSIGKDGRPNCDHGSKQLPYLRLKQRIFGGTITPRRHEAHEWGGKRFTYRWRQAANAQTRLLRSEVYKSGKKSVAFLLPRLDERSLAFWYMDDGCLHRLSDQRPLVELNTHGFSKADHTLMVSYFNDRWGLEARAVKHVLRGKHYQKLQFKVDDSEKFMRLVAGYMPAVMHYKLATHLRPTAAYKFNCKPLDYAARLVEKVSYMDPSWCSSRLYDIEVAETHNFVANQTLVHNCSVGSRTMTLARFIGFTEHHIFGMDGSFPYDGSSHAAEHPNDASKKGICETEYNGVKYRTTPAMLEAARNTWHELDMLKDVNPTFYGEGGLVHAMAKDWKRKELPKDAKVFIAFDKPELISAPYCELNRKLHQENPMYGIGGARHKDTVLKLCKSMGTTSVLDYGCGKGQLARELPFPIWEYDPAIPGKETSPRPADLVISTDVLEHIEPEKIDFVLRDLQRCVLRAGFFVIHTGPSKKFLADGRNTHLLQRNRIWWKKKLKKYFALSKDSIIEKPPMLYCIVAKQEKKA
jgi:hypothetical protein